MLSARDIHKSYASGGAQVSVLRGVSLDMVLGKLRELLDELLDSGALKDDLPLLGVSVDDVLGGGGTGFAAGLRSAITAAENADGVGEVAGILNAELRQLLSLADDAEPVSLSYQNSVIDFDLDLAFEAGADYQLDLDIANLGLPAERTAQELRRGLAVGATDAGGWRPPVLLIAASEDRGINALVDAILAHRAAVTPAARRARRRAGDERFVRTELLQRYGSFGLAAIGGAEGLATQLAAATELAPLAQVARIGEAIETALRSA